MSIKIYNGVKIKSQDLRKFLIWFHDYNTQQIRARIKSLCETIDSTILEDEILKFTKNYPLLIKYEPEFIKNVIRLVLVLETDFVTELFKSWFNAWPCDDYFLINSVFGNDSGSFPQTYPDFIQSYGCWNNVDRDETVPEESWNKREEDWKYVLENEQLKLSSFVFDPDIFSTRYIFEGLFSTNEEERRIESLFIGCAKIGVKNHG